MAPSAVAQETICALRREIARIQGEPPARLTAGGKGPSMPVAPPFLQGAQDGGGASPSIVLREAGRVAPRALATGAPSVDTALGGGVPMAALTEIVSADTRDAGACASFAFGLASRLFQDSARPVFFVADTQSAHEGGYPYLPALHQLFGLGSSSLLFGRARRTEDVLWLAEEAACIGDLSCVILEIRGNPPKLTLAATQRLNRRAIAAGRPVLLLRQHARGQPTAAPVRLSVAAAPSAERTAFGQPLAGSIGAFALGVTIDKSRHAPSAAFTVEWNIHEHRFQERQPPHSRARLSVPFDRPASPPSARAGLATSPRKRIA